MENSNNAIEKLYSTTFTDFEDTPPNEDWSALSTKLDRVNFLKFSFSSFNVFYLFALLTLICSTAYLGVNNYLLLTKNTLLEMQIETLNRSAHINDVLDQTNITHIPNDVHGKINTSTESLKNIQNSMSSSNVNQQFEANNRSIFESVPMSDINSTKISEPAIVKPDVAKSNDTKMTIEASIPDSSTLNLAPSNAIRKVRKTIYVKQNHVIVKDSIINNKL